MAEPTRVEVELERFLHATGELDALGEQQIQAASGMLQHTTWPRNVVAASARVAASGGRLSVIGLEEYAKAAADTRRAAEANLEAEKVARDKMEMLTKIALFIASVAALGSIGQAVAAIAVACRS